VLLNTIILASLAAAHMEQAGVGQQDGPQLPELLPGLSMAVRTLARAAKNVPEASDIYVSTSSLSGGRAYRMSVCRGPAAAASSSCQASTVKPLARARADSQGR
jgi:hypothetical protein